MRIRKTFVATTACVAFFLSGCDEAAMNSMGASTNGASSASSSATVARGKTAEERALEREVASLNRQTRDIIVSNTVQGALAGAAVGCVMARMMGEDCVDGALAGGVLGGVAGNQVGQQAAQANADLVRADETLAKLQGIQQKLGGIETNLSAVLSRQNSEVASLRRQLAAGQVSEQAVASRISAINNNRATMANSLQESEMNMVNERAELVSLEQEGGQRFTTTKNAVDSTRSRIRSLRNTVSLVSN
ncbi:hypothetical protein [Yoonia algicola]|uniref:Glycine zipper domain-containing protein n=1 Tax=Yoonia algicola TaxID=3137368 RepID=A0AAN0MG10_9RHOB